MIPFNKPYYTGKELEYIKQVIASGSTSGNGQFTKKCQEWLEKQFGFKKVLLTTSCTDAIELAALLLDIKAGDEIILPSYTFVSTANPFLLRGAKLVFADSQANSPNLDVKQIESLINSKTRALVIVHYAGIACDMDEILSIAKKHNLFVIEDAAQCIGAYHGDKALGGLGDVGALSFHDTKNITCGEGGCIMINNPELIKRAEIIWEKGTNRSAFFRGEVDKYGWVDIGSSYLASEFNAAILFSQLEALDQIQEKRHTLWNHYFERLRPLEKYGVKLPHVPDFAEHNSHIFYLVCKDLEERTGLIQFLQKNGVKSVFHYLSLHQSPYFLKKHDGRALNYSDEYTDCLVRLPMFYELELKDVDFITAQILKFYNE